MVRKIQNTEYLKRYGNMTAAERQEYLRRVWDWLSVGGQDLARKGEVFEARLQNVLQVSVMWNDQECAAFEEGAVLLSALIGTADTKLPELLYAISAKRSIKRMFQLLWEMEAGEGEREETLPAGAEETVTDAVAKVGTRMQAGEAKEALMADMKKIRNECPVEDFEQQMTCQPSKGTAPVRPKHIDQYVHLLPKKTQEHAALVQGLYRELEEARHKMALLMDDETATAADREAWAKKATKCDNTLRKIFDELDAEWARLVESGRVVVDDLGNARAVPLPQDEETQEPAGLTSEQRARRRELRKWLTDTRRGNGSAREERVKQWYMNFREYLTLEGEKAFEDEKIKEAIEHYGIDTEKLRMKEE